MAALKVILTAFAKTGGRDDRLWDSFERKSKGSHPFWGGHPYVCLEGHPCLEWFKGKPKGRSNIGAPQTVACPFVFP